jgi:hypothetical protein
MTTPPPPYGPYGPYPPYPPPREPSSAGMIIGLAVVGVFTYFAINLAVGLILVMLAIQTPASNVAVVAVAIGLGLFAFGGGGVLLAFRKPWAKGLGLGLMIGWALTSIFTVGICTGINPSIYNGGF